MENKVLAVWFDDGKICINWAKNLDAGTGEDFWSEWKEVSFAELMAQLTIARERNVNNQ